MQNHLKTEEQRVDYNPSTPNKMELSQSLNMCSSVASTIMLGRSLHNLVVDGMKHLELITKDLSSKYFLQAKKLQFLLCDGRQEMQLGE